MIEKVALPYHHSLLLPPPYPKIKSVPSTHPLPLTSNCVFKRLIRLPKKKSVNPSPHALKKFSSVFPTGFLITHRYHSIFLFLVPFRI